MPRPVKYRKVCCLPQCCKFGPLDVKADFDQFVNMTVDEYESIRLIDLEGLTQEECSTKMTVARTTVQLIYNDARKKLAESLVYGKILRIEGGKYQLCDQYVKPCGKETCHRHICENYADSEK